MAVGYSNESYDRCMSALRARYTGRGVAMNAKKNAAALEAQDAASKQLASHSSAADTICFNRVSGISDTYRSGEYKGSKYMTSDDFIRYFRNRRSFHMPTALVAAKQQAMEDKAQQKSTAVAAGRKGGAGSTALTSAESQAKEGHIRGRVEAFVKKWFPMEQKQGRSEGAKFHFPVAAAGSMAAFALSLGLIVSGSVMIGSASGELGGTGKRLRHPQVTGTGSGRQRFFFG